MWKMLQSNMIVSRPVVVLDQTQIGKLRLPWPDQTMVYQNKMHSEKSKRIWGHKFWSKLTTQSIYHFKKLLFRL
jgi:hypothetical protein